MIVLRNVHMQFGSQPLLRNVNLQISDAEKFVIIGPSGEGKSVLLKIMAGVLKPTQGEVFIDGKNVNEVRGIERTKLLCRMGVLFQKNALFDSLSCYENVAFPLRETTALSETDIDHHVHKFLDDVGLTNAISLYPDEISGGMQKRLGIARALALDPEIVFYDDPTAGLDPITSYKIIQLILSLQDAHRSTIVAITNDMNRAYQVANRIGMVVDGELIVTGTVTETKNHPDKRVQQFIHGTLEGPLMVSP